MGDGTLSDAWEAQAEDWLAWARKPGHDSYWRFHRDRFLELLPPPRGVVVDVGCGEGRLPRDLKARGYEVVASTLHRRSSAMRVRPTQPVTIGSLMLPPSRWRTSRWTS